MFKNGQEVYIKPGKKQSNYITLDNIKKLKFINYYEGLAEVQLIEGRAYNRFNYRSLGYLDIFYIKPSVLIANPVSETNEVSIDSYPIF